MFVQNLTAQSKMLVRRRGEIELGSWWSVQEPYRGPGATEGGMWQHFGFGEPDRPDPTGALELRKREIESIRANLQVLWPGDGGLEEKS